MEGRSQLALQAARMICTPGTREIAHVMLTDCLKFQQKNEDSEPLFDEANLERTLFHLETEPIGHDFEPLPGLKVRFINAGHIVGAACIYLQYGDRSSARATPSDGTAECNYCQFWDAEWWC